MKARLIATILVLFGVQPLVSFAADASWTDRVKFSGDFRYRHEFIGSEFFNSSTGQKVRAYDRNRHRIRLRLALQAQVNQWVDLHARVATSTFSGSTDNFGADPISTNQDLSGGATQKPIWIDRAYADFHPVPWMNGKAGKQPVPFESTDLVWDPDLNLEGVSAVFSRQTGDLEVFGRAGGYWLGERKPTDNTKHALTQGLFAGQLGGRVKADRVSAQLAVAYYDYGNMKDNPTLYKASDGFGNSLVPITGRGKADTMGYAFDYNLLDVNAQVRLKLQKVEPGLMFDIVTNTAAKSDLDTASYGTDQKLSTSWLAGLIVKFSKLPLDWDFLYNYRVQQKDATVAAFADSDPAGGGTNFNGHKFSVGVTVLPGTRLAATYFRNVKDPDHKNSERHLGYERAQADLEVKF